MIKINEKGEKIKNKITKFKIAKIKKKVIHLRHCKFNGVYDLLFERAVYDLEADKVTPAA